MLLQRLQVLFEKKPFLEKKVRMWYDNQVGFRRFPAVHSRPAAL
jgi:hypothetical protein